MQALGLEKTQWPTQSWPAAPCCASCKISTFLSSPSPYMPGITNERSEKFHTARNPYVILWRQYVRYALSKRIQDPTGTTFSVICSRVIITSAYKQHSSEKTNKRVRVKLNYFYFCPLLLYRWCGDEHRKKYGRKSNFHIHNSSYIACVIDFNHKPSS